MTANAILNLTGVFDMARSNENRRSENLPAENRWQAVLARDANQQLRLRRLLNWSVLPPILPIAASPQGERYFLSPAR